jgi:hypothetical protein
MTKKVIFTILWMVVFKLVFFFLSALVFAMLDHVFYGTRPPGDRPPVALTVLMMGWFGLSKLSPLIALALSIYGLLPGTKIKTDKEETL